MTSPLPGDIFSVGQVLNNTYKIDKILGRGGTGEVYLAHNLITDRQVAVKALNRQFSGNADYIELMKREEEMRAIQHPAVVRYTECSMSDDSHVFLVMDYIKGPPLSDVMARRQMDPRELLIIAHQVAGGLVATHAQGIIHRDLSPDNIILRDGDPARSTIIDFGIAKDTAVGARTVVGDEFAGKYEYTAPEQLEGHVDQQSDLYALGATLLAARRGETPFIGVTPGEIVRRKQSALDTEGVPPPLREIIDRLTATAPNDRPATAQAVVDELDQILEPTGKSERPVRRTRKLPALLTVCAMVVAGVAWVSGAWDWITTPALPNATPYHLSMSFDDNRQPTIAGHAPDEAAAAQIQDVITAAFDRRADGSLTLATGLPKQDWVPKVSGLIKHAATLRQGQLVINDLSAEVAGLAVDMVAKNQLTAALDAFETENGWTVSAQISAGPLNLSQDAIKSSLTVLAGCGPLDVGGATDGNFGLFDPITVQGNVAGPDVNEAIVETLQPLIGERELRLSTQVLNAELCTIRQALVQAPTNIVSLSVTNGDTGDRNLSGVFTTGENPVVDALIPEQFGDSALWVMAVSADGSVFHVVPNLYNQATKISQLAPASGGLHRIRVLHSIAEFQADNTQIALRIKDGDYGKSEVIAILSRQPLFDGRRPSTESVASTAQALQAAIAASPDALLGVASVIIDARP